MLIMFRVFTFNKGTKTKSKISCAVSEQLINDFVFRYKDSTIPPLLFLTTSFSKLYPSHTVAQTGLCQARVNNIYNVYTSLKKGKRKIKTEISGATDQRLHFYLQR